MQLAIETKPKSLRSDQLIVEELGSELMIYDGKRSKAFCLNQKAAIVWQHCDGKTTVAGIAAKLAEQLGEPADEKTVEFALHTLSQDGLLEPASFVPVVQAGMTRRDLMQKIGIRAAIAVPMVTALMVATPKAHASGTSTGGPPKKPRW